MKSYIKIYGPPVLDAIQALEKLAIDTPEVCIMDPLIETSLADIGITQVGSTYGPAVQERVMDYFRQYKEISPERCQKILSRGQGGIGEYDFVFEWHSKPNDEQVRNLIKNIDDTLKPIGVRYTITTKE
ncbi:hypothetical protein FJY84_01445 [Candidatus Bathyarchaeota archaeon]|nr:hypothetical protein [Candidatus Bathyarchaeota archaeon]